MNHRIVVLGAGYAGATAAGRLAKRLHRADVEITLVNGDADFVERVRLHQLASGQELKHRPLSGMFAGTGVRVQVALVDAIDVEAKTVAVIGEDGSETLAYDTLVYALGSTVADYGVPGVTEYAHNVASKRAALALRARLSELTSGATVLIAGGGLTGIEAASEIAEARPDLDIAIAARGGVGDWLSEQARRYLRTALDRLGVTVHEHTDIARVGANSVETAAGEVIPAQVTVWTAGFAVHPIAAASTLEVSDSGRIVVDGTMRSVSHPDVYAFGDAAHVAGVGGKTLRMGCATATPMAWQGSDALAARLTGREVPEAPIGYNTQCISLGRRDALVQKVTDEDQPTDKIFTGRTGVRIKQLICAAAAWSVAHPTMMLPSRRRRIVVTTSVTA
ncbi:NAD(P)/FAD-dependent oxidoreductase [Nocardia sp. NPDC058058]|uniref:NAD(P)/FAD-dependent oxidoreductase n=1 Tax=Nocardia sp. NPDC058058 TaxID=3346317 RepID=UPI0036DE8339